MTFAIIMLSSFNVSKRHSIFWKDILAIVSLIRSSSILFIFVSVLSPKAEIVRI
jgi:hypothetical protein